MSIHVLVIWGVLLISLMAIGGFFMFRKFLKQLPKEDGKSDMYWEEYYFEKSRHLWPEEGKKLLEELVSPVPELFRDVARQKIASKIGQIALERDEKEISQELLIEGYIIATPKKDHRFLRKKLKEKNIDVTPYEEFFKQSRANYRTNWQDQYKANKKEGTSS